MSEEEKKEEKPKPPPKKGIDRGYVPKHKVRDRNGRNTPSN